MALRTPAELAVLSKMTIDGDGAARSHCESDVRSAVE